MARHNQAMKSYLFLLLCLFWVCSASKAVDKAEVWNEGFSEKLNQAYQRALSGGFGGAFASFEKLIETNPNEFITYDLYAQALEHKAIFYDKVPDSRQSYERAVEVYGRWLAHAGTASPMHSEQASERIEELKMKAKFTEVIASAAPWERAKIYGTGAFAIKSNLPEEYCNGVVVQLREIIKREIEILHRIFGNRADEQGWVKLFITGSWEDYKKISREMQPNRPIQPKAFYLQEANAIVILFDGSLNIKDLAHEVAHYLIHANYIKSPSQILDEGMAEYVAYKLAKESARAQLLSRLEFMNWLYEQGEWERPFPAESDRFKSLETYYLRAWALIYFLNEGGGESFSQFFREYLIHEKSHSDNDDATFQKFFERNFSKKELEDLNNQWQSFTLSLNYEKI